VSYLLPVECKREGEYRDELRRLLQEAIDEKLKTMREFIQRNDTPVILALYDAYGFAECDDVREEFLNTTGYDQFHSVFLAASFTDRLNDLWPDEPGRTGYFLYSKNPAWQSNLP
jgi:hypothetical protein